MALQSGLAAQLGFVAEGTYGTRVVPTRFLEFVDEDINLNIKDIESASLRSGNLVRRNDRKIANKIDAGGPITLEVMNKGFGLLFKHMLGQSTITTPMGGTISRLHTHVLADLLGLSLTTQVGRPDIGGTVRPYDYTGCKVQDWEIVQELDKLMMLKLNLDAQTEDTTQSLATFAPPATQEEYHYGQCTLTIAGSGFDFTKLSLKGDNGINQNRRFVRSNTLKKEPLRARQVALTGDLEGEFNDNTAYLRFVNRTVVQVIITWTGSIIEGAIPNQITITLPAVRFTGKTPGVKGPDVVQNQLPFEVLDDGTNAPITIAYQTTDTAS